MTGLLTRVAACVAIVCLLCGTWSCSSVGPEEEAPFVFRVTVTDTLGNPVEGLRVGACNTIRPWYPTAWQVDDRPVPETVPCRGIPDGTGEWQLCTSCPTPFNPMTKIWCVAKRECHATLIVYELNGVPLEVLADQVLTPGAHEFELYPNQSVFGGTRGFEYEFRATSTTGDTTLFIESHHTLYYDWNPQTATIGTTDGDGTYETSNRLHFPHLYEYPVSVAESADGESLCVFAVPETVAIMVSDTLQGDWITEMHLRTVEQGTNEFDLIWNH